METLALQIGPALTKAQVSRIGNVARPLRHGAVCEVGKVGAVNTVVDASSVDALCAINPIKVARKARPCKKIFAFLDDCAVIDAVLRWRHSALWRRRGWGAQLGDSILIYYDSAVLMLFECVF